MSKTRMGDEEQPLQGAEDSVSPDGAPTNQPDDAQAIEPEVTPELQPELTQVEFVDPWVGQYLSDYYIMRRIGEGGMGIVYLARHQSLDRLAAVKFLAAHMVTDKAYIERFLKEARGAAKLNHPNIVAVYDAGSLGENVFYFIMEYVEGRDLGTMLRERRMFPVPEAVTYMRQAASALGYAHKKRIIHRDIKPDNFMLTNEGIIKVGDLGLAKWMSDDEAGGMTQSGVVMGTPFYISPEQVRGSRDVDLRSDIYSLGATFFHLVTGRIPYEGSSPAVIMAMHLNNTVPDPSSFNNSLDMEVAAIIKKMMAKMPDQRFQNMDEVDAALSDYQAGRMRSVRFNPGALAGLPPSTALPPTEPPRPPSAPPERLFGNPTVVPTTEPLISTKTALILGGSLVAAAVIFGAFTFLGKAFDYRKGKEAQMASQPVLKVEQPPAPQVHSAAAKPPMEGAKPAPVENGFVRAVPAVDVKIPTEATPPHAADATIVANFNGMSDEMFYRGFQPWADGGARGGVFIVPRRGADHSEALELRYDDAPPGSKVGVLVNLPAGSAQDYQAIGFRARCEQVQNVTAQLNLKWMGRDSEQISSATVDLVKEWKNVTLPMRAMNVAPDAKLIGLDIYFKNTSAESAKGTFVLDDIALLKRLPEEKPGQAAKVEFLGSSPLAPVQVASHPPSNQYTKQTQPGQSFGRTPTESPGQGPGDPNREGMPNDLVMTPDGIIRPAPVELIEELKSPAAEKKSYFTQKFDSSRPDQLPKGIMCAFFDPSRRNIIQMPQSNYNNPNAQCEGKWETVSDAEAPNGKYLKLWHQTAHPQWSLGAMIEPTSNLRGKKFLLNFMVRGAQPGTRVTIATQPDLFRSQPITIGTQWTTIVVPMPLVVRELKGIIVGVQGTGEIHIAGVRADPMPEMVRKKMEKDRIEQMRGGMGTQTGGTTRKK